MSFIKFLKELREWNVWLSLVIQRSRLRSSGQKRIQTTSDLSKGFLTFASSGGYLCLYIFSARNESVDVPRTPLIKSMTQPLFDPIGLHYMMMYLF